MKALAVLLLLAAPLQAQSASLPKAGTGPTDNYWSGTAAGAVFEAGMRRLLRFKFEEAREGFRLHIEEEPDDPAGYLFEAGAIWWEEASEPTGLRVPRHLENLFFADVSEALRLAKRRFRGADARSKADAHFLAGMTLGLRGLWHLKRGESRRARSDGRKGARHLRKCLKLDPKYSDAHLGLGLYGLELGEEDAVYRLRTAMKHGTWTSVPAAFFLLSRQIGRRDYAAALKTARGMRRRYPESPLLRVAEICALHRVGRWRESYREGKKLFDWASGRPAYLGRLLPRTLCGLFGSRCLDRGSMLAVSEWTSRALETGKPKGAWRSLLHLLRGVSYDLNGDRDYAVRELKRVRRYRETMSLLFVADVCRSKRCRRGEVKTMLHDLSDSPRARHRLLDSE